MGACAAFSRRPTLRALSCCCPAASSGKQSTNPTSPAGDFRNSRRNRSRSRHFFPFLGSRNIARLRSALPTLFSSLIWYTAQRHTWRDARNKCGGVEAPLDRHLYHRRPIEWKSAGSQAKGRKVAGPNGDSARPTPLRPHPPRSDTKPCPTVPPGGVAGVFGIEETYINR